MSAGLLLGLGAAGSAQAATVVADRLDNPRGLDFAPNGHLYVAESGRGGSGPCLSTPEMGETCLGATGAVTRIDVTRRTERRVARGLASLAPQGGDNAAGPSDVSFRGRSQGYLLVGLAADPSARDQLGSLGRSLGRLYQFRPNGQRRLLSNIARFEAQTNPVGDPDSNPNSVDSSHPRRVVVVDAGANTALKVNRPASLSFVAILRGGTAPAPAIPGFPVPAGTPIPYESVPTSVVRGPDGAYYVGELTGFPFPEGAARVHRVAVGGEPTVHASGFTQITDLAFGRDGSLFVLQFATRPLIAGPSPAALIRVRPDGTREELAAGELQGATGLALDPRGRFAYVSNRGESAGAGQVVRIRIPA